MVHGNAIDVYYGITITDDEYNKIKKIVSLEHSCLFKKILNGGKVSHIISGKIDCFIEDKTDYFGKYKIYVISKDEIYKLVDDCIVKDDKIDYLKLKNKIGILDIYDHVDEDIYDNYIEKFLINNISSPSYIKIINMFDLEKYCSIEKLSVETAKSYNEIKDLLEIIKSYVDVYPKLFLYKYSY